MALRKRTTTKRKADPSTKLAKQVGDFMIEELGVSSAEDIAKICQMLIDAAGVSADEELDEEEEAPRTRKSSRKKRTGSRRKETRRSKPSDDSLGRVALWENMGDGNYEFSGNIKFNFEGESIQDEEDVDLQLSVMLFEPDEDANYIYGGILTETVTSRKRAKQRPPIVGRIYVYDSGAKAKKSGMEAYAYCYLMSPDDEGDNIDPDYLVDMLPEELIPEKGAFCKLLIYENDNDSDKAPLYVGKATLPEKLEDDEEEEAPRRSRRKSKRTSRGKAEATTTRSGRKRKGRGSRKSVDVLNFSATDMPDVYDDEEDDEDYDE